MAVRNFGGTSVLTELRQRGVQDVYVASMDGSKGLPEAVNAVFPRTLTQLCIVHLVRASLRYVSAKDSKAVVAMVSGVEADKPGWALRDEALGQLTQRSRPPRRPAPHLAHPAPASP